MFSNAIALASPSGKMSKRALKVAQEQIRQELFGNGLEFPSCPDSPRRQKLLQQAKELRALASRGMKPRAYLRKAELLEIEASTL